MKHKILSDYLEKYPSGHNLHIILDDGNVENSHLDWCKKVCELKNDLNGLEILKFLYKKTSSQRFNLYRKNWILK